MTQLNELSKKLLGRYINKAADSAALNHAEVSHERERRDALRSFMSHYLHNRGKGSSNRGEAEAAEDKMRKHSIDSEEKHFRKVVNRIRGIQKATDRLTKEEVESLDEGISQKSLNAGDQVIHGYRDHRWKATFKGYTSHAAPYSESPVFHNLKDVHKHYGTKNTHELENHPEGRHVHSIWHDNDNKDNYHGYLYKGNWALGSSADKQHLSKLDEELEMNEDIQNMVDAAVDGKPTEFADSFESVLNRVIQDKVAERKFDLQNSFLGVEEQPEEMETPEEEINLDENSLKPRPGLQISTYHSSGEDPSDEAESYIKHKKYSAECNSAGCGTAEYEFKNNHHRDDVHRHIVRKFGHKHSTRFDWNELNEEEEIDEVQLDEHHGKGKTDYLTKE